MSRVKKGFGDNPDRLLYRLHAEPIARHSETIRHQFLVRWWDDDVYVPCMKATVYTLVEHCSAGGNHTWELITPNFRLYGIEV
jgi:hypothetical protein